MSDKTPNPPSGEASGSTPPLRGFGGAPFNGGVRILFRDKKFRWAWGVSVVLHAVIFAAAAWTPSSANYRFFGSGTAVSLVGADEIPGGSARGKSGDRPEDLQQPKAPGGGKARKIATPEKKKKKKKTKVRKRRTRKKKSPPKKSVRKLPAKKKKKKKKKKISKARLARIKRLKARKERLKKWRRKRQKLVKGKAVAPPSAKPKSRKTKKKSGNVVAKNTPAKPKAGYLGEGGGDGQGGGSLGGWSGGVARSDIDRYYGLLGERVSNFWTVPPSLTDLDKLKTIVIFDVSREGAIRGLRIEKTSGNRVYDTAALRAVQRAANPSFPTPPNTVTEEWLPLGFRFCGQNFCR
jgi:protein TonB